MKYTLSISLIIFLLFFSACNTRGNFIFKDDQIRSITFYEKKTNYQNFLDTQLYRLTDVEKIDEFVQILNNAEEYNPSSINNYNYKIDVLHKGSIQVYIDKETNFGYFEFEGKHYKFQEKDIDKLFTFEDNNND